MKKMKKKCIACLLVLTLCAECFATGSLVSAKEQETESDSEGLAEQTQPESDLEDNVEEYSLYSSEDGGYISSEMEEMVPAVSSFTETELLNEMGAEEVLNEDSFQSEETEENLLSSAAMATGISAASLESGDASSDADNSSFGDGSSFTDASGDAALLLQESIAAWIAGYPSLRNQGSYNTCWAFATMSMAEIGMVRAGLAGSDVDYSEMALAYEMYHTKTDPLDGISDDTISVDSELGYLHFGGSESWAMQTLAQWAGVKNEASYPYEDTSSLSDLSNLDYSSNAAYLLSYSEVNLSENPDLVKGYITSGKAVFVPIYVATNTASSYYNWKTGGYYCPDSVTPNHAVAIVGYDNSYSKNNFSQTPEGDGAWLVRNSWGGTNESGEYAQYYGYFWVSYYDNSLSGAAYVADFGNKPYDNNYQYDGGIQSSSYMGSTIVAANIFTASASDREELDAVSIDLSSAQTDYCVEIYANLTDEADPTSGELISSAKGTTGLAGLTQIPLDSTVPLRAGEKFAVVVTLSKDSGNVLLRFERNCSMSNNGYTMTSSVDIKEGQSFYKTGDSWHDLSNLSSLGYGNFRIKAYTDNIASDKLNSGGNTIIVKEATDIAEAEISEIGEQVYSGKPVYPEPELSYNGEILEKDRDYSISYSNNSEIGKAKLLIRGKGDYNGSVEIEFDIVPKNKNGISLYHFNQYAYFTNGQLDSTKNGLYQDPVSKGWYYLSKGIVDSSYSNLLLYNGGWYYVKEGKIDWSYSNLVNYNGGWYYVHNGKIDWSYTTLSQVDGKGSWYYVHNGKIDWSYYGLYQYYGVWYYIEKGVLNWNYNNLVKYNGGWYYVHNGKIDWTYTTLSQVDGKGSWYYVQNGQINWKYTGLFQYYGTWYYIENGVLNWNYNNLVYYNGGWYYVKNGKIDWNYSNLICYKGTWYYVCNGAINWSYSTLAQVNGKGSWYYVKNGKIDWSFTGTVTYKGKSYSVVKGVVK